MMIKHYYFLLLVTFSMILFKNICFSQGIDPRIYNVDIKIIAEDCGNHRHLIDSFYSNSKSNEFISFSMGGSSDSYIRMYQEKDKWVLIKGNGNTEKTENIQINQGILKSIPKGNFFSINSYDSSNKVYIYLLKLNNEYYFKLVSHNLSVLNFTGENELMEFKRFYESLVSH